VEFDESKNEEAGISFYYGATLNFFPLFCAFHLNLAEQFPAEFNLRRGETRDCSL